MSLCHQGGIILEWFIARAGNFFPVLGQIVNILGSAGHMGNFSTLPL